MSSHFTDGEIEEQQNQEVVEEGEQIEERDRKYIPFSFLFAANKQYDEFGREIVYE